MLFLLVLLPFLMAILLPLLSKLAGKKLGWLALPIPALIFFLYLTMLPDMMSGSVTTYFHPWVSSLGVNLSFRLNGLSLLFALLISGIGTLVVWYSIYYLSARERLTNFYVFLMLFMGAMLGVVTSSNLILTYLFWELTSISSFLLIGFWFEKERSTYGAQKALLLTVTGGFALLIAFLLLGKIGGSFEITTLLAQKEVLLASPLTPAIILLILLGAFTKSAQVPFHIWLPTAMEAPTPISCYLHSATMVKAGIFLLALFAPFFNGIPLWNGTITLVGLGSLLFGSVMALRQKDLKALLAYSTISQLGLIVCLIGIGTQGALIAALFHLLNHSAFKGSLFLMTGIVDHETGVRDITLLRGLAKAMPFTAAVAFIGSLSMAGLPPFSGFLSKELFLEAAVQAPPAGLEFLGSFAYLIPVVAVLASLFTFVYSLSIFGKVFLGKEVTTLTPKKPHEAGWGLLLPPLILVSLNVLISIIPNRFAGALIAPAVGAVTGTIPEIHLAFWHGLTLPLLLTLIIILGGALVYANLDRCKALLGKISLPFGSEKLYNWSVPALLRGGARLTDSYMNGLLRNYLIIIFVAGFGLIAAPLFRFRLWGMLSFADLAPFGVIEIALVVITVASALATVLFVNRVWAILSLGVCGYAVTMFFVVFSAPDLALTQLLVESANLVLFLLVLKVLPAGLSEEPPAKKAWKGWNALIAAGVGAMVAYLSFFSHSNRLFEPISHFFLETSKTLGGGNNVVNVMLVDFRGLDTMGEISVLGLAAIGVLVLVNILPKKPTLPPTEEGIGHPKSRAATGSRRTDAAHHGINDVIMLTAARSIAYIIMLTAAYLFLAGHNAPGGGFIAGLMVSAGLILVYVTLGQKFVRAIRIRFKFLIPLGLTFAVGCGLGGLFFGKPFLTHTFGHFVLPFFGDIELATAMIFDFGVFLVVVGTMMSIIFSIGKSQQQQEGGQ